MALEHVAGYIRDEMHGECMRARKQTSSAGRVRGTQEEVTIPQAGKIYAFNEGKYMLWDDRGSICYSAWYKKSKNGKVRLLYECARRVSSGSRLVARDQTDIRGYWT